MKTLCIVIALCLFAIGCDEKPKQQGGHYSGPGPDGIGHYEGPARLVPNKGTHITNDRELDNLQEAARANGENGAMLKSFNDQWESLDR